MHTFPKCISTMWNAKSLMQDSNSDTLPKPINITSWAAPDIYIYIYIYVEESNVNEEEYNSKIEKTFVFDDR